MPYRPDVKIDYPVVMIQQVRLLQALAEAEVAVYLHSDDRARFAGGYGSSQFRYHDELPAKSDCISFDELCYIHHPTPETRVGRISRPLIFPQSMFECCRKQWATESQRQLCCFPGLLTPARVASISRWVKYQWHIDRFNVLAARPLHKKIYQKLQSRLLGYTTWALRIRELRIEESTRGRIFPHKLWDSGYFSRLCRTRFVLCPDGDFGWSYRFFESMMCGAIPVVETAAACCEGYEFYEWDRPLVEMEWTEEKARRNFQRCLEQITIPRDDLLSEVCRFVDHGSSD